MSDRKGITVEEMKLVKFKTMVNGLWKQFGQYRSNYERKNPLEILIGSKLNNEYAQIILDNSFSNSIASVCCIHYDLSEKSLDKLIDVAKDCNGCRGQKVCKLNYQIIFFSLLALAVDNELYNEKVNVISDFAYLVGFDSAMMKDWTNVVKKVLMAESLNLDELETDKAKEYFKCLV